MFAGKTAINRTKIPQADNRVKAQADWLASKLTEAGVSAKVVAAEGKNHGTINSDLGLPDDKPTKELFEFMDGVLKKK